MAAGAAEQYGLRSEDLEGIAEHPRSIGGTRMALFFRDLGHDKVKVSFRSTGDVDVNTEDAYFTGEESPGGDNPTPDQDIVDDIGKALGLQYDDNEELKGADKVEQRDKHRWELDPASSDDYKDRK